VIVVRDTLRALQDLARAVRRASGARVVAITGSTGKTTTKEVTAELLSARYRVFRNRGNLNNHVGLPISLLELVDRPDLAVVELGMNHEGEIRTLVRIAEPDIRVWTNVGDAHFGHFGSREAVARAKAEILEGATERTLVVSNADDPLVAVHVYRSPARQVTFGFGDDATVRATHVEDRGFDGTRATVETPHGVVKLFVPLAGRAQLTNVLAATAIALDLGVSPGAIEQRVSAIEPVARRGAIRVAPNGARVVDDSYNASPAAVRAMLAALRATAVDGRRVAVLGEMLELGSASRQLHETCGQAAAAAGVGELVVIGGEAADGLATGAMAGGLSSAHIHRFADSADAAGRIHELVEPGDLVLVKGSRGTRTDVVVDRLVGVA
jgi:UDP-N-acetylmuramoyl-tripeptide--D-alanyl-D-alanine ligase